MLLKLLTSHKKVSLYTILIILFFYSFSIQAQATYVGGNSTCVSSANSITLNTPPGDAKDLLVASITAVNDNANYTTPAGWTLVRRANTSDEDLTLAVFYRVTDGTESNSYTFNIDISEDICGSIIRYDNVAQNLTNPITASAITGATSGTAVSPSVFAPNDLSTIVRIIGVDNDADPVTIPTRTTLRQLTTSSTNILAIADSDQSLSGNSGTANWNHDDEQWLSVTLAIQGEDPCKADSSGNLDSDGDNIADICDIDDDNDGIPDIVENEDCAIFLENFGTGEYPGNELPAGYTTYNYRGNITPFAGFPNALNDGDYAITTLVNQAEGSWQANLGDHTTGSGYMMVVNANITVGDFYHRTVTVSQNTTYNFSAWFVNANSEANETFCDNNEGGLILPNVRYEIRDIDNGNNLIASFETGDIPRNEKWQNYFFEFNSGTSTNLEVALINNSPGGCGNDLALDDITIIPTTLPGGGAPCDFDGDGVPNSLDLDSDNDGIYDILEAGGTDSDNNGIADDISDLDDDGLVDIYDGGCTASLVSTSNLVGLQSNSGWVNTSNALGNPGSTFTNSSSGTSVAIYDLGTVVSQGTTIDFAVGAINGTHYIEFHSVDAFGNELPGNNYIGGLNPSSTGPETTPLTLILNTRYIRVRAYNEFLRFYGLSYQPNINCAGNPLIPIETTAGVKDMLNTDSDNDGCNDVLEAGFTDNDNDGQIDGSGISNNGVVLSSDGYTGTSSDVTDESVSSGCPDQDEDGIFDNADIDDDNDGILDIIECNSLDRILDWSTNSWAPGTTSNSYSVNGQSIDISVTDASGALVNAPPQLPFNFAFYQGNLPAVDETLLFAVDLNTIGTSNNVTITFNVGTAGIGLENLSFNLFDVDGETGSFQRQEQYTITGSLSGNNVDPLLSNEATGVQTISGNIVNGITPSPSSGAGSETGTVYVNFEGFVDTVTITFEIAPGSITSGTSSQPGFGIHDISFGSCPDTDGDGIPNSFDLDSDNDGCPDAIEAAVPSALISSGENTTNGIVNNTENAIIDITTDPVGANGFANSLESADTNLATAINSFVVTNYANYAVDNTQNGCGIPMITQVYWNGAEKIIEITNIDDSKIVVPNAANLNFFSSGTTSSLTATTVNSSEILAGNSILFSASSTIAVKRKLGGTVITNTGVTNFSSSDDIITISRSGNTGSALAYDSRIDEVSNLQNKTSFVRIDETLTPNKTYTANEWVLFVDDALDPYRLLGAGGPQRHPHDPLISEINTANTEANILLGLHRINPTVRSGGAWSNGYPDRSRHVGINEDYNHTTNTLSARKLNVNTNRILAITDNLLVVTNDIVLNGEIRLVNPAKDGASQLIQTHEGASLVTGTIGKLLVDQNSTVPSKYRYNYIGSPVKTASGSTTYTVDDVLKDGTNPTNATGVINGSDASGIAKNINWIGGYDGNFEGSPNSPISLADYWIYTYSANGGTRAGWEQKLSSGAIPNTDGFIFKGPGRPQNYTYAGIPKDGDITTTIGKEESYLVANPYASSISVKKFIEDNIDAISGTLYFWEHAGEKSSSEESTAGHNFAGYIGGYATRTITMGVTAKNAAGGSIDINLQAESATLVGGDVETIADPNNQTNIDILEWNADNQSVTFKKIPGGIDTLRVRYRTNVDKLINLKLNSNSIKDITLKATSGGLFEVSEIPICIEAGSDITLESLDGIDLQLDYIKLKDDGEIACAPSLGGDDITYTEPKPYIPIGQGFFVQGDETDGGTITFNNSQREYVLEGTDAVFFKSKGKTDVNSIKNLPVIKLGMDFNNADNGKLFHRQIGVSFSQYTSFDYDRGYDAEIYDIGNTDFYWKFPSDDKKYVIAGVPEISDNLEIPLEIIMGTSGYVSLKVDEMKNVSGLVYILDKVTGISYEIVNNKASLTLDQGEYKDRFFLAFKPTNTTLSVEDDNITSSFTNIYVNNKNKVLVIAKKQQDIIINQVQVYSILGSKIYDWQVNEQKQTLQYNLNKKLPTGIFFVKLKTDKGQISKKVILE